MITADTNVLVRVLVNDDPNQSMVARAELEAADGIALAVSSLCELVWVLARGYRLPRTEIATAVRRLVQSATVVTNRPAVEAGLAILVAGGDFADGVIEYEGRWLGADCFVSFDRQAVTLLGDSGQAVRLLG